ncbi:hypothetical protein MRX96_026745 [Rhipicephalus microplus]
MERLKHITSICMGKEGKVEYSGIQSTSSEALQAGLSEPGEEASGGGIEPGSPRSTAEPLPLRRSTRARKPPDKF